MSQKTLIQQLKKREKELIEELEAIQVLIATYEKEDKVEQEEANASDSEWKHPKGAKGWEDYAVFLLERLGGKAKASVVADAAVKANPTFDPNTVRRAITTKLSIAARDGRIDADKPAYKKEGFTYMIKRQKMVRTKPPTSSE